MQDMFNGSRDSPRKSRNGQSNTDLTHQHHSGLKWTTNYRQGRGEQGQGFFKYNPSLARLHKHNLKATDNFLHLEKAGKPTNFSFA
jgi:hypothetical protein